MKITVLHEGVQHVIDEHTLPLLSVSHMAQASDGSSNYADEATEFDAATQLRRLEDLFQYYNIDVDDWVCWSIADNRGVNKRLVLLLDVPMWDASPIK